MRDLEPQTAALLAGGRFIQRDAILFDFAEGTYAFWWGRGSFAWNGITFRGAGKLLKVSSIRAGDDMPPEIEISLSAIPDSEITPDVLGTIEEYTYHLRPALLYRFYFHPVTGAMVGTTPDVFFRGQVDQISHVDEPGGPYQLVARLVSRTVDLRKAGQLKRGIETQRLINGGDTDLFFEHATTTATQTAKWGAE